MELARALAYATLLLSLPALVGGTQGPDRLELLDVFELEWVSDPQISPDGSRVVYERTFNDIMADTTRSNLWIADIATGKRRPLTTGNANDASPRWSPGGDRLLYVSSREGGAELWLRWMDTGQTAKLTNLTRSPNSIAWSPDGRSIAFSMFVPQAPEPFAELPPAPEGADWADPARVMTRLQYRADGAGYLPYGFSHVFVLSAEGGSPRQLTSGDYHHGGNVSWLPDGSGLVFSANRREDWDLEGSDSDVYRVAVADGELTRLTDRFGPDFAPAVSPDGRLIAWTGYDERYQGYQVTRLHVMSIDGSGKRVVSGDLDRDVSGHVWRADGSGLFFQYDDEGNTKAAWPIQGWIVKPPGFDPSRQYPLILEIHGGPFAAYSDFFAAEIQLFAAAGYVVLYTNPRGSTSYGEEFGNLIHHAYPSQDYDDLMSGVDAVIERGYIDEDALFVTGGSGGGVLTAWIVGHTEGCGSRARRSGGP